MTASTTRTSRPPSCGACEKKTSRRSNPDCFTSRMSARTKWQTTGREMRRNRSAAKINELSRTTTASTVCPAKSREISRPSSATRLANLDAGYTTLSSDFRTPPRRQRHRPLFPSPLQIHLRQDTPKPKPAPLHWSILASSCDRIVEHETPITFALACGRGVAGEDDKNHPDASSGGRVASGACRSRVRPTLL